MSFRILNTVIKLSVYIVLIGVFLLGVQLLMSGFYPHFYEPSTGDDVMLTIVDMEYDSVEEGDTVLYYNPEANSSNMNVVESVTDQKVTLENGVTVEQARISGEVVAYKTL